MKNPQPNNRIFIGVLSAFLILGLVALANLAFFRPLAVEQIAPPTAQVVLPEVSSTPTLPILSQASSTPDTVVPTVGVIGPAASVTAIGTLQPAVNTPQPTVASPATLTPISGASPVPPSATAAPEMPTVHTQPTAIAQASALTGPPDSTAVVQTPQPEPTRGVSDGGGSQGSGPPVPDTGSEDEGTDETDLTPPPLLPVGPPPVVQPGSAGEAAARPTSTAKPNSQAPQGPQAPTRTIAPTRVVGPPTPTIVRVKATPKPKPGVVVLPNGVVYGERKPDLPNRIVRIASPPVKVDTTAYEVYAKNGQWEVADYAAGHHYNSKNPGEGGNIVLAGHNNWRGEVFRNLEFSKPGDLIRVWTLDGKEYRYKVESVQKLLEKGASMAQRLKNAKVMDPTPTEQLTLITCWPYTTYTHRLIVIAKPAP